MAERCVNFSGLSETEPTDLPLFSFGVITDVQYGDIDDGQSYDGSRKRYYRNAKKLFKEAVETWNQAKLKPCFVVQLGDFIEGHRTKAEDKKRTVKELTSICDSFDGYFCHLWGNHEFYQHTREELCSSPLNAKVNQLEILSSHIVPSASTEHTISINGVPHLRVNSVKEDAYYFTFCPHPKFKFISLGPYDINLISRNQNSPKYQRAMEILTQHNTNTNWNSPSGLKRERYVKFNGGIGTKQLDWLEQQLSEADEKEQKVIILTHISIHPKSSSNIALIWNHHDILKIIHRHKCVALVLAGHEHDGGSCTDKKGTCHITLPAVLECNPGENAYGTVHVYDSFLRLEGIGRVGTFLVNI